jgi:hypothetical protein
MINSSQILPFDIDKPIGEGGFSTVYKAKILDNYHDYKIAKVILIFFLIPSIDLTLYSAELCEYAWYFRTTLWLLKSSLIDTMRMITARRK